MDLPEVEPEVEEPDDEGLLFDARRSQWTQLGYYKWHQGKPMPEEKTKACEVCGTMFHYQRKTARHCIKACGLRAMRQRKKKEV